MFRRLVYCMVLCFIVLHLFLFSHLLCFQYVLSLLGFVCFLLFYCISVYFQFVNLCLCNMFLFCILCFKHLLFIFLFTRCVSFYPDVEQNAKREGSKRIGPEAETQGGRVGGAGGGWRQEEEGRGRRRKRGARKK